MQKQLMLIWYVDYYPHHTILSFHKIIVISVSKTKISCLRVKKWHLSSRNFLEGLILANKKVKKKKKALVELFELHLWETDSS